MASSAVLALGLEKNPQTGQYDKDLELARFHIDMLAMLAEKTKNNLTPEESGFLDSVTNDLKMKYVYANQKDASK